MHENTNKRRQSFNETDDYSEIYDKTAVYVNIFAFLLRQNHTKLLNLSKFMLTFVREF